MEAPPGMTKTSRRVQGPGLELVGLVGDQGAHTGLLLPETSPCRAEGLSHDDRARAFLERPGIAGLARMAGLAQDRTMAWYAAGEVWSAAEVMASLRRRKGQPGLRAGIELAWRVSDVLFQAERDAAPFGLRSHGAIDPWRLALRKDGQVIVLGYGLATGRPHQRCQGAELAEALRYAPPERLSGRPEDGSADVLSLALVALEWAVGTPVYEGEGDELVRQVMEAEGDRRLWAWRERLPADVVEVFGRALRRDVDARWPSVAAFKEEVRRLVSHPAVVGPTLMELMGGGALDAPGRYVGLAELRGSPAVAVGVGVTEERAPSRWVSLGGRNATATRLAAEAREKTLAAEADVVAPARGGPVAPPRGAPVAPPPPPPVVLTRSTVPASEPEAETAVAPAPRQETAPTELHPPATAVVEEVAGEPEDTETLYVPRAASREPVTETGGDVQELRASVRETAWQVDEHPTTIEPITGDLVRVRVVDADERVSAHLVGGELRASELMEVVVRERGLPRSDLLGATVFAWRFARGGVEVPDGAPARELSAEPRLSLVRIGNRPVLCHLVARDEQGELWLTSAVGTAVPVSRIVSWAVQVLGLEPGDWTLTVGGAEMLPDAVLEGRLEEGGLLELSR
jgi:hypothetical protein